MQTADCRPCRLCRLSTFLTLDSLFRLCSYKIMLNMSWCLLFIHTPCKLNCCWLNHGTNACHRPLFDHCRLCVGNSLLWSWGSPLGLVGCGIWLFSPWYLEFALKTGAGSGNYKYERKRDFFFCVLTVVEIWDSEGASANFVPRVLSLPRESTLVTAGHVSARILIDSRDVIEGGAGK